MNKYKLKNGTFKIFTITVALLFSSLSYSKPIYEFFKDIEPLLKENKYEEANLEFEKLSPKFKKHSLKHGSIEYLYKRTFEWLQRRDKINSYLQSALKNIESYKVRNHGITKRNCSSSCVTYTVKSVKGRLPKTLPFSKDFVSYINTEKKYTENYLLSVISDINKLEAQKKQQKIDSLTKKREEKRESRELRNKNERIVVENEVKRLDSLVKSAGYMGYENKNIISLIYTTQKEGGLEKHLNMVVGCHKYNQYNCKTGYAKLKAIQILDDAVLYSYSEFAGNSLFDFSILSNKEDGKIYQEGQAIKNTFHVFTGMYSYKTVLGITKTVPVFKSVNIN